MGTLVLAVMWNETHYLNRRVQVGTSTAVVLAIIETAVEIAYAVSLF